jgi:predicted GIY-YIG superfamily endonuclease
MLALGYCGVMKNIHKTLKMHTRNVMDVFYQQKKTKLILEHGFMSYGDVCACNFFRKKRRLNYTKGF